MLSYAFKSLFKYITRVAEAREHFVSYGRWRPISLLDSIPIRRMPPVNGGISKGGKWGKKSNSMEA